MLRKPWHFGELNAEYNRHSVNINEVRFGELSTDAWHREGYIGYPRAKLIFEVQASILSALRIIVNGILHYWGSSIQADPNSQSPLTRTKSKIAKIDSMVTGPNRN